MRDTIDMAREVGIPTGRIGGYDKELKAFEALVRADERSVEREACAKLADDIDPVWESVSAAIRARGDI
jgi:hypothetical protein